MPAPSSRALLVAAALVTGCAHRRVPDPREAALAFEAAVARGDAAAVQAMLPDRQRAALDVAAVKARLDESRAEIDAAAKAVVGPGAEVRATATLAFADGDVATLELERGAFWVGAADTLPAGGRTPQQALSQLRRALGRRSWASLLRVLTPETRAMLERDMRTLVEGLDWPDGVTVRVDGDAAEARVRGGHVVKLRRAAGVWRVEDFD